MGMLEDSVSLPALRAALEVAVRNRGGPGPDGVTVAAFAARAEVELDALRSEVLSGAWRPRPARRVLLPKPGGGYRPIAICCVRDRVLQHSLASELSARLDCGLHRFAFAWRRGRAAREALDAVEERLASGYSWVLRADIEQFFDRISPALLLASFENAVNEPALVDVVRSVVTAGVLAGRAIEDPGVGTPQGSPLSPLLANLYLVPFDTAIESAGFTMVRYGDDFCVNVATRQQAEAARATAMTALARLRLSLNELKVEITHHGQGFVFLGFQFHPNGRRAGARAARQLARRLDDILQERPKDGGEEIDAVLHGWLAYYGSLSGIDLPQPVRERAEALEAARAQHAQFGPAGKRAGKARTAVESIPHTEPSQPHQQAAQGATRWQQAAEALHQAAGGEAAAAVGAELAESLRIDPQTWTRLSEALAACGGPVGADALARAGHFADAADAERIRPPAPRIETPDRAVVIVPEDPKESADAVELPTLDVKQGDAERILELFGGAEHTFPRDLRVGDRNQRERIVAAPTAAHVREHLSGAFWMGVFPLRANNGVRFAAIRVVVSSTARKVPADDPSTSLAEAADDVRKLVAQARE